MRYLTIITLFCFSAVISLQAQHIITIAPEDSICLRVDNWRGDLQWQMSYDDVTWNNLPAETKDSLKYVPRQFPSYFRLKITEGACAPYYSETTKVILIAGLPTVVTTPVNLSAVGTTNAVAGGNVTNTGASTVTARGIVYSTSPNPSLHNALYTVNGTGSGNFIAVILELSPVTTYYIRAYATNSKGTSYGQELSFPTRSSVIYSIGDTGPAGGIVYYDKGSYSDGWRFLEVAPKGWMGGPDPSAIVDWGCNGTFIDQTFTDIGMGKENTNRILANGCVQENTVPEIVAGININGYSDWFLPSRDELGAVYNNLFPLEQTNFHDIYGFQTVTYATSSEINDESVWGIDLAAGGNIIHAKVNVTLAVRPVRRF